MKRTKYLFLVTCFCLLQAQELMADNHIFYHPERIRYDSVCMQIEGKDVFVYSGAFHYFRVPKAQWEDRMVKMKEAGFNGVETYVPWNWSERSMPKKPDDYSKVELNDLKDFLALAEKYQMYVSLRPGPYICAEWSGGGYPQWMMKKRPKNYEGSSWLQSNDPTYLAWCSHWYKAVADVARKHQITNRKPNTGGVIVWQIENEFNRVNWISKADKQKYLEFLAKTSRDEGIDVLITSCWTTESRNVDKGYLNGVVDMVNSYPLWNVEKGFGGLTDEQQKSQPGKPLMSEELQGGWYTEVGGTPSWKKSGISPVQTQNLTMYALQRGYSYINYYMLVGGTNLDDWSSRTTATTYDYSAAIGEDGSINEKYMRLKTIGDIIKKYGCSLLRTKLIVRDIENTNKNVEITLRQNENGDCFYFFRTNDTSNEQSGTANITNNTGDKLSVNYTLEPFGAVIYYLPANQEKGIWLGYKKSDTQKRQEEEINLTPITTFTNASHQWKSIKNGTSLVDCGIYGKHLSIYKATVNPSDTLEVMRIGDNIIYRTPGDIVSVYAEDKRIKPIASNDSCIKYVMPTLNRGSERMEVSIALCDRGLHHHTNSVLEKYWDGGLYGIQVNNKPIDYQFAYDEDMRGIAYSSRASVPQTKRTNGEDGIRWYKTSFTVNKEKKQGKNGYRLHLENKGNGYLYLNGHCLGRIWQEGPQQDYNLPECYINQKSPNYIVISLMSDNNETEIDKISLSFSH